MIRLLPLRERKRQRDRDCFTRAARKCSECSLCPMMITHGHYFTCTQSLPVIVLMDTHVIHTQGHWRTVSNSNEWMIDLSYRRRRRRRCLLFDNQVERLFWLFIKAACVCLGSFIEKWAVRSPRDTSLSLLLCQVVVEFVISDWLEGSNHTRTWRGNKRWGDDDTTSTKWQSLQLTMIRYRHTQHWIWPSLVLSEFVP